ncbi:MAG: hypothetical protein ACYC9L_01630 [Sulfuricaulis sp.]
MIKPTLVFVYNADSGLANTLLDICHKIVSPQTYNCNLCLLTHATLNMRREWKEFVEQLGVSVEFLHRDELSRQYEIHDVALPAVFRKTDGRLQELIDRDQIDDCHSLDELKRLVEQKLQSLDG